MAFCSASRIGAQTFSPNWRRGDSSSDTLRLRTAFTSPSRSEVWCASWKPYFTVATPFWRSCLRSRSSMTGWVLRSRSSKDRRKGSMLFAAASAIRLVVCTCKSGVGEG
eukprot:6776120-Prymnesium_polylepis.1